MTAHRLVGSLLILVGLGVGLAGLLVADGSLSASPIVAIRGVSPDATADNGQRKLAMTSDGTLYLAYSGPVDGVEQAQVAFSLDGGSTWKPEIVLGRDGIWSDLPSLAAEGDRLDATWVDYISVGHVWHATLQDGTWSGPMKISPGDDYAGFPALAITGDEAQVLWYAAPPSENREHGSAYEIHHTTGTDGAWSDPVLLSSGSEDALNPALAKGPDGNLEASWFQIVSSTYGAQHTTFDGGSWSDAELISALEQTATGVSIEVGNDGVIHLVWEQAGGASAGVAYASKNGGSWSEPVMLSESLSQDPVVAVTGDNRPIVLWSEDGRIKARIRDRSWSAPSDLGPGSSPSSLSGEGVLAAWTRPAADSHEVVTSPIEVTRSATPMRIVLFSVAGLAMVAGVAFLMRRPVEESAAGDS